MVGIQSLTKAKKYHMQLSFNGNDRDDVIILTVSVDTFFYWSIVDLQYCVSFRCTAK